MKILRYLLGLSLMCCINISATAETVETDKESLKEKFNITWPDDKHPATSGIKEFDEYVAHCDTLMDSLKVYVNKITWYKVSRIKVVNEDNSVSEILAVVDENGTVRNSSLALRQYIDMISSGLSLTGSGVTISTTTAAATSALAKKGLKGLKYAKYMVVGPKLVKACGDGLLDIINNSRKQATAIRALKNNFNENGELINPELNLDEIEGLDFNSLPTVEKTKDQLTAEFEAAVNEGAGAEISDEEIDSLLNG